VVQKETSPKKIFDINVLGQVVRLKHDDEDYVRRLEDFVQEKLKTIQTQPSVTSLQAAVRLLLLLADDYFSALKEKEAMEENVDSKAKEMIDLLDRKEAMEENVDSKAKEMIDLLDRKADLFEDG
jgi:cell division protein ZapA (FtsZ GTPase activity inhibitor)